MLTALLLALATGAAAVPTTAGPVHIELRHHVDHSPGLVSREDSSLRWVGTREWCDERC